jgi:hypothetical protein
MELYIIKHRSANIYYKRLAPGAFKMVLDVKYATRFDKQNAFETVEFLNSIGSNVIGQVDNGYAREDKQS